MTSLAWRCLQIFQSMHVPCHQGSKMLCQPTDNSMREINILCLPELPDQCAEDKRLPHRNPSSSPASADLQTMIATPTTSSERSLSTLLVQATALFRGTRIPVVRIYVRKRCIHTHYCKRNSRSISPPTSPLLFYNYSSLSER